MIPSENISFNDDGTAWLVLGGPIGRELYAWRLDRPCDTCGGDEWMMEPEGDFPGYHCGDCIDGRHTFTIEVECEWCDDGMVDDLDNDGAFITCPECNGNTTFRVSIVPGMVLRIYDPATGCLGPATPHICWSAIDRHVDSDTDGCWLLVTNTLHDASPAIILPSAAAPGMWAVKLQTETNQKEAENAS